MKKAVLFWSGGKDSAFALHRVRQLDPTLTIVRLVTTLNDEFKRISMHGVREELLDQQAESIGLPLQKMWVPFAPDNTAYESALGRVLTGIAEEGISHVVFGDIFLEDLKQYRDNILAEHGLTGVYPLWKTSTNALISDFLSEGFRTVLCCIQSTSLDESWLGREIDADFVEKLPFGVDFCGENGEFHTFCFDGPIFAEPLAIKAGEKVFRPLTVVRNSGDVAPEGFWFIDLY